MSAVLPPGMTEARFSAALRAIAALIGQESVFVSDEDLIPYHDAYGFTGLTTHRPGAAIAPGSVEELQAVLRVANEHAPATVAAVARQELRLWRRGARACPASVVLDLGRMRRILDIDVERGVALLEPGVGFFDLYQHLEREKIPLWASVPGNSLGSVIGNALEYGLGYGAAG